MKKILFGVMAALTLSVVGDTLPVLGGYAGSLEFPDASLYFQPCVFAHGWNRRSATEPKFTEPKSVHLFRVNLDPKGSGESIEGRATFTPTDGAVEAVWSLPTNNVPKSAGRAAVRTTFSQTLYAGGSVTADDKTVALDAGRPNRDVLRSDRVTSFALQDASGALRLKVDFRKPTEVLVREIRDWGLVVYELQFGFRGELAARFSGERPFAFREVGPVRLTAGAEWVPLAAEIEIEPGSALDFSGMGGGSSDAPAGKHGWLVAKGNHFEFEKLPGVPQRFYGVNICGDANAPDPETARRFARNLRRIGYNMLRFHHHESCLVEGSPPGSTELNAKAMERFDALVAACVENGIYMTTDLFVSRRPISWKSLGFDRPGDVSMTEFKGLVFFNENAFSNYLAYARAFLGHVNRYTGRRLADEPALATLSFVNEGNLNGVWWSLKQLGIVDKFDEKAFAEIEARFARRVTKFLREEMKCKALTSNMNNYFWNDSAASQLVRAREFDYADDHFYVDHPRFLDRDWSLPTSCPNTNPLSGPDQGTQRLAVTRILDRPFTITEYNFAAPGRFRGVGGILTGALGARQDWSGLVRFAWTHGSHGLDRAKALGFFDMSGDPLGLAAERASICLFLRRDLEVAERTCAFVLSPAKLADPDNHKGSYASAWAMDWAAWRVKIGSLMADAAPEGVETLDVWPFNRPQAEMKAIVEKSGPDGVVIDSAAGSFTLDTPRTVGGFAESGTVKAGPFVADLDGSAATIWASTLDNEPIASSRRLLLTHLTDVQNTGTTYADEGRRILLAWGSQPHLMRAGRATVKIRLAAGAWQVWTLTPGGRRRQVVPSTYADGQLTFVADVAADPACASYLYEIVR